MVDDQPLFDDDEFWAEVERKEKALRAQFESDGRLWAAVKQITKGFEAHLRALGILPTVEQSAREAEAYRIAHERVFGIEQSAKEVEAYRIAHERVFGIDKPEWDADTGSLKFRRQVVRRVSGQAKNVRSVLAAFQVAGWPTRIDDPLPGGKYQVRLNDTVKSPNEGLSVIRFRADGTGAGYRWEVVDQIK